MKDFYRETVLICAMTALYASAVTGTEGTPEQKGQTGISPPNSETATLVFSADQKYETKDGIPRRGDPYVCQDGEITRVNAESNHERDRFTVPAGKEVAVSSVITLEDAYFRKTCGYYVGFVPENGVTYTVVVERIGGKGIKMLWTGVGRQSCAISVYKQTPDGFTRVETQVPQQITCRGPAG